MGEFKRIETSTPTRRSKRHHKQWRTYEFVVPWGDVPIVQRRVENVDSLSGEEVRIDKDGTTTVRVTYGPIIGNSPGDVLKPLIQMGVTINGVPPNAIQDYGRDRPDVTAVNDGCFFDCPRCNRLSNDDNDDDEEDDDDDHGA